MNALTGRGTETRLDRDFGRKKWGDEGYAMEELVAELGAAFLCADLELEPQIREDHAPYIASWLKVLKEDKRAIFTAAAHAQRACGFPAWFAGQNRRSCCRMSVHESRSCFLRERLFLFSPGASAAPVSRPGLFCRSGPETHSFCPYFGPAMAILVHLEIVSDAMWLFIPEGTFRPRNRVRGVSASP